MEKTKRIHIKVNEKQKRLLDKIAIASGFIKSNGTGDESKLVRYWIDREAELLNIQLESPDYLMYFQEFDDLIEIAEELQSDDLIDKITNFKIIVKGIYSEIEKHTPQLSEIFIENGIISFLNTWNIMRMDDEDEPKNEKELSECIAILINEHVNFLSIMGYKIDNWLD